MPILPHAKKKIRVDKRRALVNKKVRTKAKKAVKDMRTSPSAKNLTAAFSALDRAAKTRVMHTSTVDRLKGRLSKLVKEVKTETKKKTAVKKKTVSKKK